MPAKELRLDGYGKIFLNTINRKKPEWEVVDMAGQPLTHVCPKGERYYATKDGTKIPNSSVCKKIIVEGEEIIAPKFAITKEVSKADIEIIEDNSIIYRAEERKMYNVTTDSEVIKDLVLNQHKSLMFPIVFGSGWELWNGILTYWNNKLILFGCIGDIDKELEKYDEDTVEISVEALPQQQNMKKLLKAMVR